MSTNRPKPPEILDKIVDIVLAHKTKTAKAKAAKKRKEGCKTRGPIIFDAKPPELA